ncbi:MAG: hypothetical protein Kow0068_20970 [Marinilabiliales bacterium]
MEKQEIDLIELIRRFILLIKKYYIFLIILIFIAIGLAVLKSFISRNYYKNTVLLQSTIVDNIVINELLKPVNFNLKHNPELVIEKLQLNPEDVAKIKEIKLDTSYHREILMDLYVYDTSGYKIIVNHIINYLNTHPYVTGLIEKKKEILNKYMKDIDNELQELNTYQSKVIGKLEDNSKYANSNVTINSFNLAYNEMLDLMKEKYNIADELNKIRPINIISLNKVFDNQISLLKNIIIFISVFLIAGIIIIIFKETKN